MSEKKEVWIDWPHDDCPECGGGVEILTDVPQDQGPEGAGVDDDTAPPWVCSGDKWRCEDGHEGSVYCDSESPVKLEMPYVR